MRGKSYSHLISGSNSKQYVVKFLDNPQHRLVPANEWLASHLASLLGLTTPRVTIIDVPECFIQENPELTFGEPRHEQPHTAGLQFGSEMVGGLYPGINTDYLPSSRILSISNRKEFFGALVFDRWVCNADARQAVFVTRKGRKTIQAHFIDHGHCFGSDTWQLRVPERRSLFFHEAVYYDVTGLNSFEPWLEKLKTFDDSLLWQSFATMPAVWYERSPVKPEALIDALAKRRHIVPELIASLARAQPQAFPLWRD